MCTAPESRAHEGGLRERADGRSEQELPISPFPPIGDYAFLSDCETTALIAPSGNVEWLCLPRMDSPSVFGSILDRDAGGFRVGPADVRVPSARRYIPGTMVLETTCSTPIAPAKRRRRQPRHRLRQHDQGGACARPSVTGNPEYIARAREWVDVLDRHYWADGHGGYFFAADDTGDLIVRTINALDDATPNANGTMVSNLMQLYLWTGEERYRERAEAIVRGFSSAVANICSRIPGCSPASSIFIAPAHIVIVVPQGGDVNALRRALADVSLPNAVVQEVQAGESVSGQLARARQDGHRQQAHRLCLHRPAMLRAGDGAGGAGGGGAGGATERRLKWVPGPSYSVWRGLGEPNLKYLIDFHSL